MPVQCITNLQPKSWSIHFYLVKSDLYHPQFANKCQEENDPVTEAHIYLCGSSKMLLIYSLAAGIRQHQTKGFICTAVCSQAS